MLSAWPLRDAIAWAQPATKPKGLSVLCFSCLSNASPSEAMFLLKPLKELRAKRKGTRSCLCVCVCVHFQEFFIAPEDCGYF